MSLKKEMIIEAARTTLIREGSSHFSMRKVAEEASMSLGNLQYYFKTKSDLIQGILKRYIVNFRIKYEDFFQDSARGREGLRQFICKILIEEASEDDPFFIALDAFEEQKGMEELIKYLYGEVFSQLGIFLEKIAGFSCTPEAIYRATALLLPYIEGYSSIGSYVKLDHHEMSELLAGMVWSILREQDL